MAGFARHLFVCVNERELDDARGSCAARGGAEVAEAFKRRVHELGLKRVVRANKAGCLDQCARGVCVVVYPEGVWYGGVRPADVEEILASHVLGGRPVERLRLAPGELTGKEPAPGTVPPLADGEQRAR